MRYVFTEYVRSLSDGEPSDPDLFGLAWEKLRDALRGEMRRRGLWDASPGYLGIHGPHSWSHGDALDDLVGDCFAFILDRLPSLKTHLKVKDNVEGLFFRSIRNFLYDTQKKHDPLGFRVFTVAQSAIRQLIADTTLFVLAGDPGVKNETVLGFAPAGDGGKAHVAALEERVPRWNDELMPTLVTAKGKHVAAVVERLTALISRLPDVAIELFRFKDLVGPLKSDARRRWNVIWAQDLGEMAFEDDDGEGAFPVLVRLIRPDSGVEERESFGKLITCVDETLDGFDEDAKIRRYLVDLWTFLRNHAAEPPDGEASVDPKASKLPSGRKIAGRLGIPRDRLKGLFATLGGFVEDCQAAISGKAS